MIRQCSLFLTAALLAANHTILAAVTDPFVEQNGRLLVEMESETAQGDWSVENAIDGYTGSAYLVWEGVNNYAKSKAPRGNPIKYNFTITTPGNYELRWRSRNTVGLDATEHNDSWVRFPTGKNIEGEHFLDGWTKAYMGQVAQWTWDVYTVDNDNKPIRQFLDAGDHSIDISGRSNGHGVDRFALFRYDMEDFDTNVFDALRASPRASRLQELAHPYSGNSCVGGNLSLATESVAGSEQDATAQQAIFAGSSPDYGYLRFDLPKVVDAADAILQLSSNTPNALQLSVYLGSHSNWNASSNAQSLPDPATLLGVATGLSGNDSITSTNLDLSTSGGEAISLVLIAEPGPMQSMYGIGSRLEPRLNVQMSDEFCTLYNTKKVPDTSENDVAPPTQPPASENPIDSGDEGAAKDGTDQPASTEPTATDRDHNESEATDSEGNESDANALDNVAGDVENENTGAVAEKRRSSRFGGSLSLWTLVMLTVFTAAIRRRQAI